MSKAAWEASRPELTRDSQLAISAWNFCDGWHPERIPLAAAFYGIDDVEMLTSLLLLVRNDIAAREQQEDQSA